MTAVARGSLQTWLRLGRVSNLPTVFTDVLAGAALAGASLASWALVILLVAASSSYLAGMILNDAFDRGWDARHRPDRPIPAGEVAASRAFLAGALLLGAGVALAGLASLANGAGAASVGSAAALASCIVAYDARHKQSSLAPWLMGGCRALVYVLAAAALAGHVTPRVLVAASIALAYVAGLTVAAKHAPRRAGAGAALPIAGAALLLAATSHGAAALPFVALFGVSTGAALFPRPRIARLVAGICLLDACLLASAGRFDVALLAAACAPLTVLLQRRVGGT